MLSRFGSKPTMYQNKVNSLTGALGPKQPAFWKNNFKLTGPAYSLAAQPLYYAPAQGFYVTSADVPAANGSVNFSNFGFGRKRSRSRRRGSKRRGPWYAGHKITSPYSIAKGTYLMATSIFGKGGKSRRSRRSRSHRKRSHRRRSRRSHRRSRR